MEDERYPASERQTGANNKPNESAASGDEHSTPHPTSHCCGSRREQKHPLEWAIGLLVFFTLIATAFAAYYTKQQWITADEAEKRSLRAYMILTDFGIFCPDCGDTTLSTTIATDVRNSIRFRIEDNGQTPAYQVTTVTNWIPVYSTSPDTKLPDDFHFANHLRVHDEFISSSDIGRDHHKDVVGAIAANDIQVFKDAGDKKFTLFVYGHIDYCDIFDNSHSTAFCFKYIRNGGLSLPICDRYNGEIAPEQKCKRTN